MRVGLRVCVNTLYGALEGVPNLLRLFNEYQIQASFFFAMGPDNSGRVFSKNAMQPWLEERPFQRRLRDFFRVPPQLSHKAAQIMRSVAADGHEIGLLGYDRVGWIKKCAFADENWTQTYIALAVEEFEAVLHQPPKTFAAAGWQVNPFLSTCPQIPTTLPTLSGMLGVEGVTRENVHEYLYAESQYVLPNGHIYSLDAEMEGIGYLPLMEKLVVMWKGFGEGVGGLGEAVNGLKGTACRYHQVGWLAEKGTGIHHAWQSVLLQ
ncbi:MAG: polysaccharide deacetylase family protein [Candidatus Thiodiazotropha sp.]